jgi:hypothetical protein
VVESLPSKQEALSSNFKKKRKRRKKRNTWRVSCIFRQLPQIQNLIYFSCF